MQTRMILFAAAASVTVGLTTGCATTETFSYLDGYRWNRVELNTFDVTVISVDGQHYIQRGSTPIRIEPGERQIVVQGPPTAGFRFGEQRKLSLKVEPCTHYWLEAKKENSLAQDFEPRVNYTEKIAGCGTETAKSRY